ncbi:MAG: glutamine hydrolyzing CTP synthase [Candidatus Micrarchaeia archaeon]
MIGSIMSGLGKGIVTSSIMKMLDFYDYRIMPLKFDGYLNYDCGTMNPYRHGEVFVLDDKSEVDMDFGMYERFINKNLTKDFSMTGGKIFSGILAKERHGDFLGEDVQIVPHLVNHIIDHVKEVANKNKLDVLVIEVGGTAGDIENNYFIEAMRQLALKEKVVFVNLTYIPKIDVVGEQKTKPAQHAFRMLMQLGIMPNFVVCRLDEPLEEKTKAKLSIFMNIGKERIIDDSTAETLYEVPLRFISQGFDKMLIDELNLEKRKINKDKLEKWKAIVDRIKKPKDRVKIAIVGKYTNLRDSYASVKEALIHSGAALNTRIDIKWVESSDLEKSGVLPGEILGDVDGIIVPGGFGKRGIEGKIKAIEYARSNRIPYLGLCLGMQLMAVEFARNVCALKGAHSTEFAKTKYNVIDLIPSQRKIKDKGATMRLGAWPCKITDKKSIAFSSYHKELIYERHRHRYEFNNRYRKLFEKKGMLISGVTPDNKLVEIMEWKGQFGVATQSHPELKSRLEAPAPLFVSFVSASKDHSKRKTI